MSTLDQLQNVRRLVPTRALPEMVRSRVDKLWTDEAFRVTQEAHMRFLLEHTDRAPEIPELARAYAERTMLRGWLRWHPRALTRQRVVGIEHLTTGRDPSRSVILSFMHHNQYDGMFASLSRAGAHCHILALAEVLLPTISVQTKQHMRVVSQGSTLVSTTGGTAAVLAVLKPGVVMAIASDVASKTPVEFLGRKVMGSFGAARIASTTNSPVVIVTAVRDGEDSHHLQVHAPLEPADFEDPAQLLTEMLRRHGEAVLAWPEAFDTPLSRFGKLET